MSTPGAPHPAHAEVMQWAQTWAQSLATVLTQLAGSPFTVDALEDAPPDAVPPMDTDLQMIVTAAGSLRGEMSLRLPRPAVLSLAQFLLSEPQDPSVEFKPDHPEAAQELLRQVAGHVATALKPRWGEVQLHVEAGPAASWPPAESGWIASRAGAVGKFWLEWQASAALAAALGTAQTAAAAPEIAVVPAASPENPEASSVSVPAGKLDLLIDVELDVTLRFGGRSMRLQEILELGPGSVVELDRQVQDPADLLLDGKLIARGEVVVIDGNYGLRVLEVVSVPALP